MLKQQSSLFEQIQQLKLETKDANDKRIKALTDLENLRKEIDIERTNEERRKKYVYDVVINEKREVNIVTSLIVGFWIF